MLKHQIAVHRIGSDFTTYVYKKTEKGFVEYSFVVKDGVENEVFTVRNLETAPDKDLISKFIQVYNRAYNRGVKDSLQRVKDSLQRVKDRQSLGDT